jgi:radical SAM protein with 4Fe4S-binding SPASM domain
MINISKLYCGLAGDSDYLRYSADKNLGPVIAFNCTSRCNLYCLHCYSSSQPNQNCEELTTDQAKKLLSQLVEVNCPVVLFSGGEPLLRNDLFELLAEAKRLGLRTVISSNGTLIDEAAARQLADAGVSYVGISIDGTEEFHDKFRRSPGCFKAAMIGIKNCKQEGIKTGLRFTITKANAEQIPAVFDIAASSDIRRICFYHLVRAGRATCLRQEFRISNPSTSLGTGSEFRIFNRKVLDVIIEKTRNFVAKKFVDEVLTVDNHADGPYLLTKLIKINNQRYESARKFLLTNGGNKVGEKIGCVGWDGNVYPDQFWRGYCLGNIKDKTFKQIWENPDEPVLNKLRNKSRFADPRCLRCKWFDLCKGNYRFLTSKADDKYWLNEPACYLTDEEISKLKCLK